jgi:hypothetical protein
MIFLVYDIERVLDSAGVLVAFGIALFTGETNQPGKYSQRKA